MAMHMARRDWMKAALVGLGGARGTEVLAGGSATEAVGLPAQRHLQVDRIERMTVEVPFRPVPERNMARELPHWKYFEIFEVHLRSGHVGYGETMIWYTWRASGDAEVKRALGRNAAELMWDDSLGAGLQMALFDGVAKAAEVPLHCLLGRKVRDRAPLSWWDIDMPPEDWATECREAHQHGYMAFKTKGRPWFDVWRQVEVASRAVPESFKIDIDFNGTLLDAERAIPILKELEASSQVGIFETPIPQADISGNRAIRAAVRVPLAMHYGAPPPREVLRQELCDGFVIGGGASSLMHNGAVAAMADMPFWLQLVGTGLTAAWSLHFGSVLSHARWPAVNCHQLYTHCLLAEPIRVKDGLAQVPDAPGLGFDVDRDAIQRWRIEKPRQRPDPPRLIETRWPDGRAMYFAEGDEANSLFRYAERGKLPYFQRGVTTRLVPDNGSPGWRDLHQRAQQGPVTSKAD